MDITFGERRCGQRRLFPSAPTRLRGILALVPLVSHAAVWAVSGATVAAILVRPRGIPEWCWAVVGAAALTVFGLLPAAAAFRAVWDGADVYLFLAGMLALSELARVEGVFDWLAALAVPAARGSTARLFAAVYVLGVVVTALLSNDATVLLLTPAVFAVVRRAGAAPLPFLFACAFVANAASFVLPISNPANLVVFRHVPTLGPWLAAFSLSSLAAILCTYAALRLIYAQPLSNGLPDSLETRTGLGLAGKAAAAAVAVSALIIALCAAVGWPIGLASVILGAASVAVVTAVDKGAARAVARQAPWSIVPLVAGLFVVVAALDRSGVVKAASSLLARAAGLPHPSGSLLAGGAVAIADNVFNNLPVGVLVRYALHASAVPALIGHAVLVAVDLGPNLSVTGSLATLLWLIALRREGIEVTPWQFLRAGVVVTVPALVLALLFVR